AASYTALARVHFALTAAAAADPRMIAEAGDRMAEVSDREQHGVAWPSYRALGLAYLAAAAGERDRAVELCEPLLRVGTIPMTRVLAAELYRKAGQPQPALDALRGIGQRERVSYIHASGLVTTAVILFERGERDRAHRMLEKALDVAEPEGIARPFVTDPDDDPLREMLTAHAVWGSSHEGFLAARIASGDTGISREDILGVALSPREREIFGYLCTTMTADEIAADLFVSVNTVRTHQRAIYRKLGVNSRRDAVKLFRS
ncbi:MAG: hypothetical protein JST33_11675, partial [Actinobacteria bacterium]|nr:hypothetical protein [Actinomycetota bacterium]